MVYLQFRRVVVIACASTSRASDEDIRESLNDLAQQPRFWRERRSLVLPHASDMPIALLPEGG